MRTKRYAIGIAALLAVTMLAACGKNDNKPSESASASPSASVSASPSASAPASPSASAPNAENSKLSAAEVFDKTIEALKPIASYTLSSKISQKMTPANAEAIANDISMDMDLVNSPLSFKQITSIASNGVSQNVEMYYTKDGMIMKDPASGQWMKLPQDQTDAALAGMNQDDINPSKEMEGLKPYAGDLKLEETDKAYIVKLDASGEKFNEFVRQKALENLQSVASENPDFKIHKVDYSFTIDKQTYLPISADINMNFDMEFSGQQMAVDQKIAIAYSKFNEIKEIVLPDEAKSAVGASQ